MMMIPRRKNDLDWVDEVFGDSFFTKKEQKAMRTDIKEKNGQYIVEMDLPGYEKENIKIEMEKGYLTIKASVNKNIEEEKEGNYIHKERYVGECSRSFFVGEDVKEEEIKASFKNGTLTLTFPKVRQEKLDTTKYIPIE